VAHLKPRKENVTSLRETDPDAPLRQVAVGGKRGKGRRGKGCKKRDMTRGAKCPREKSGGEMADAHKIKNHGLNGGG